MPKQNSPASRSHIKVGAFAFNKTTAKRLIVENQELAIEW